MKLIHKLTSLFIILSLILPLLADARAGSRAGSSGGGYRSSSFGGGSYRSRAYPGGGGYNYRPQSNYRTPGYQVPPYASAHRPSTGGLFSGLVSGLLGAWLYNKLFVGNPAASNAPATTNTPATSNAPATSNTPATSNAPATSNTPAASTTTPPAVNKNVQQPTARSSWGIGRLILFLLIAFFIWRIIKRRSRTGSQPPFGQNVDNSQSSTLNPPNLIDINKPTSEQIASNLTQEDYNSFERLLKQIQQAWSDNNLEELQRLTTPSVYSYFAEILEDNKKQGIKNQVSQVTLLNQKVEDSWQEQRGDYATVALTWNAIDYTINNSLLPNEPGYLVEGSTNQPTTVTEIWTFERFPNSDWRLAEINQA
jgi:hypothetical protein